MVSGTFSESKATKIRNAAITVPATTPCAHLLAFMLAALVQT
jgi:hypothetical protein